MSIAPVTAYTLSHAFGQPVEGRVLVSERPFSARYDLDRDTGVISRLGHPLRGRSIAGMILVSPGVQGGVAAGWTFMKLAGLGVGFAGLVFGTVNPVMVQGAVAAGLSIGAGVDPEIFGQLRSDMIVRLDPPSRQLTIIE